jgi:aminopeptidase N
MKYILLLAFVIIFNFGSSFSQDKLNSLLDDPWKQPVDMSIDVIHIKLNLDIEPYKQQIKGSQSVKFKTLATKIDSLVFYGPELEFQKVTINGVEQKFSKKTSDITVYLNYDLQHNQAYEMLIDFIGNPTEGLYFSGWNDKTNRHRKQIWAHSPQNWMPFINQKHDLLTTEIITTFDSKYKVFSNGDRINEKKNSDGTTTWHYKIDKPHVIYLVCLVIGDYDYKTLKSIDGVPLELWYYTDLPENFEPTYIHSAYMIDFFEKEIGVKYPWTVYRQAPLVNYMYGGMETTTATVFGDYMYLPQRAWWMRNYVNVNSHELNHQWFGNLISHLNNRHTWLTESFATYYAKIFEKDLNGDDYYQWERDKELIRTFNAAKINNNPVSHSQAGTDRWYPKGSLVLDMMRDVLGDTLFRLAIKYYTEKYSHQVTETYDLQKSIRESTGVALDWFFDQWILRGGEPYLKIKYSKSTNENGNHITLIDVEQIHKVDNLIGYFKFPVEVHVYYRDGSIEKTKSWINSQKTLIEVPNPRNQKIDFVIFDPNRKIIKKVNFVRDFSSLISTAEKAENMIDRYDALLELRSFSANQKRDFYKKIYKKEKFHLTKSEIVLQLSNDDESLDLIVEAINDNDALVRRAVVENVVSINEKIKNEYEKLLKDSCFINTELALRNLSKNFNDNNYLKTTENEIGWRGKNIRIAWLEIAYENSQDQKYLDELIDYTSLSFEFETRINAFNTLRKLNYINSDIVKNAVDANLHFNFKLRNAAFDYLKYMYAQNYGNKLIDKSIELLDLPKNKMTGFNNLKLRLKQS